MNLLGWIGVDLDGTLAHYDPLAPAGAIGKPIKPMVRRVKRWVKQGFDVRIFTARVDGGKVAMSMGLVQEKEVADLFASPEDVTRLIQDWTEKHIGVRLPVTNAKDYGMIELWDDRAVRVAHNQGCPCCMCHCKQPKGRRKV